MACRLGMSAAALILVVDAARGQSAPPPEKVVGRDACAKCHVQELEAWKASKHATSAWNLLDHANASVIAKSLGINDVKKSELCTSCHGTRQRRAGQLTIAHGNSCESCHGGAGGPDGWFETHSNLGLGGKTMEELREQWARETADHRRQRLETCSAAGMRFSEDVFSVARSCLQCHTVPNAELIKARHPTSESFEFVEWSQGEVRHNFLLDPRMNGEAPTGWLARDAGRTVEGRQKLMYIAGQLADLEISLRNRSVATEVGDQTLGNVANDRIRSAIRSLKRIDLDALKPALKAVDTVSRRTLRKVDPEDARNYSAMADQVEAAARDLLRKHADGRNLPEVRLPSKKMGDVFSPG